MGLRAIGCRTLRRSLSINDDSHTERSEVWRRKPPFKTNAVKSLKNWGFGGERQDTAVDPARWVCSCIDCQSITPKKRRW